MSRKLIKVAKELNVGLGTIVDHLSSKNFEVENKPNFNITEEMYTELLIEFKGSLDVKEKADQLSIGSNAKSHSDETRDSKKAASTATGKPLSKFDELLLKSKKEKETEEPKTIELATEKVAPPKKDIEIPTDTPIETKTPLEKSSEETSNDVKSDDDQENTTPSIGLKVVGKIDLSPRKSPKPEVAKEEQVAKETPAPNEEKIEKVEEKIVEAVIEKETPKVVEEEKVVEQKTTETPKETEVQNETPTTTPTSTSTEDVYETKVPQLKGLKIMGKIDTDAISRKKKPASTPPPTNKGTQQAKPQTTTTGGTEAESLDAKKKRKRKKLTVVSGGAMAGQQKPPFDRSKGPNSKFPSKKPSDAEKQEISSKDIDDQIKATLARLSGGGGGKSGKKNRNRRDVRENAAIQDAENLQEGILEVTEFVSVSELANLLDVPSAKIIMTCMNLGVIVSINQRLDAEIIELIASEFNKEVKFVSAEDQMDILEEEIEDDPDSLLERAPIVTVMGHVDHGKTSLLDYIRKANVASGEAGGITQHIGAYEVLVGPEKKKITFLDTPGHEAFTAMRARGAKVTDVAIIIIAADDSIMPQTREAISHAQAAGVPMIFAINKIDKPGADTGKIKQELASMNLLVEEWGGKYQSQDISAKSGLNIDQLLEKILLEAEMLGLQANPDRQATGTILEASLDKGRGYVAKALVQNGTLAIGDAILAGETSGKVKAMFNERGVRVKEAGPSTPVLILGLNGAPQAGELFKVMVGESEARTLAARRAQIMREQANRASKRISLDEIGRRLALGTFKELNLIVKGDVDGSIEALADSLIKLSIEKVQVNVIHKAVGQIIESDVLLASASDAIIVGFQVRPSSSARQLAEKEGVQIKLYSIIYEAIEEIKLAIEGLLEPTKEEKIIGQVSVREVFKISKVGTIAGCYVDEGKILRNSNVRIIRDGIVIYPTKEGAVGELASLKRYKDDVKEVRTGMECGLNIKNFNDIKVGDNIEAYEITMVKAKID